MSDCSSVCAPVCPISEPGQAPAPRRFRGLVWPACGRQNGVPAEAQRQRVRWGEEEQQNERVFALLGGNERYGACDDEAQGEDGKKAGRKPRRFIAPGLSLLPAVRAVSEGMV